MTLSSPAFDDGASVPRKYTHDGIDRSPPLRIDSVPEKAQRLVLIVDDPDAPDGTFIHWLLWGIPTETTHIPGGINQSRRVSALNDAHQGTNGFGELGYLGPRPPTGDAPHTYRFLLYAVESPLNVQAGARYNRVRAALQDVIVDNTKLTGTYARS